MKYYEVLGHSNTSLDYVSNSPSSSMSDLDLDNFFRIREISKSSSSIISLCSESNMLFHQLDINYHDDHNQSQVSTITWQKSSPVQLVHCIKEKPLLNYVMIPLLIFYLSL